jgi:hypothetical protein
MTALSATQISALRQVIEQAPDAAVDRLELSLDKAAIAAALGPVGDLVRAESEERRARTAVFAPLLPLCTPCDDGPEAPSFPDDLPARLWRGLKAEQPRQIETAVILSQRVYGDDDAAPHIFDTLCREAAAGLRARSNPHFIAAADRLEVARAGDAELFAGLLEVAPIARAMLPRLPAWLGHMTDEAAANVRLAFKDATEVAEDAGPRLMEILFAHLAEPSRILRLISAVMDHPGESYVAASELSGFGDRLLADLDRRLAEIAALDPDGGPEAGARAGRAACLVVCRFTEFEHNVDLARKGPWGQRIGRQKLSLAAMVESRLKLSVSALSQALPLKSKARGAVRGMPNLVHDPDPRLVGRALTLLAFFDEIRTAAATGGFNRPRAAAEESLSAHLDQYVEDLLDMLHAGDADLEPRVRAYLDIAAQCLALVTGERAADVARRRAAAA